MFRCAPCGRPLGGVESVLAIVRDVTQRKADALARSQAQRLKSLGVLAGGVAHDFNNLLVGILGNAETALARLDRPSPMLSELESAGSRVVAARIEIGGECAAHSELSARPARWDSEVRALALSLDPDRVFVERVQFRTRAPIDTEALLKRRDPVGELLRALHAFENSTESLAELCPTVADLAARLPLEITAQDGGLDLADPEVLRALLPQVEQMLLPLLLDSEEAA